MDDYQDLLPQNGYRAETPLRLLVRAIIAANPSAQNNSNDREAAALSALLGQARSGPRGKDDDELLREIARRYFAQFSAPDAPRGIENGKLWQPPLEPIVKQVVPGDGTIPGRGSAENLRGTLIRKFREQREMLLQRVTGENDWEARDTERQISAFVRNVLRMNPSGGSEPIPSENQPA